MFSFVLLDESVTPSRIIAARDPIGITTLYQGWHSARPGTTYFSSELKTLVDECDRIVSFPPGHVYDSADGSTTRYFRPTWWDGDAEGPSAPIPTEKADLTRLREALEAAVRKRLMSEVPYGVLLSGGLDSSLIAAIASRETEKVAQKHYEARQRKIAEHRSGPPTPGTGLIEEYGSSAFRSTRAADPHISAQKPSYHGLSFTHSPLGSRTRPTCSLRARPHTSLARCTTNTCSPSRRGSTRSRRSSIISRRTT